jgi:proline iminopeptidase
MKAKIRGTEIYFDIAGMQLEPHKNDLIEKPILFMLHGGPGGDHLRFKQHSLELQKVAQLVFIDHRGCGQSKKTKKSDYTIENNIEDIEALRKHLGLEKICILGTSYGGMVAQGYAIRYPKNLDKLILVATSPSYRFMDEAKKTLQERGTKKQIAISQHLWNGTFKNPKHVQQFFQAMESIYSTTSKKNRKKGYSKSKTIWSHEALNMGFGGFLREYDYIKQLKKIKKPTLILSGKNDWICSPKQAKTLAENIPKSKLHLFENCGHSVAVDAHGKYIQLISQFLKK